MATDIKLDQHGGNWLVLEGSVVKTTATDLMLDSPGRRRGGSSPHRRALVHDHNDGLTINYAGDYPGGVAVAGNLAVSGEVSAAGQALGAALASLQSEVAPLGDVRRRLDAIERTIESLLELVGAVVIPAWPSKREIEEGDDMGMWARPAAELGLTIEYVFTRQDPRFDHEDVVSLTPQAGTVVGRGSTVVVELNLEG